MVSGRPDIVPVTVPGHLDIRSDPMPRVPAEAVAVSVSPSYMLQTCAEQVLVPFAVDHPVKGTCEPPMSAIVQVFSVVVELFGHNFLTVFEKV